MSFVIVGVTSIVVGAGLTIWQGIQGNRKQEEANQLAQDNLDMQTRIANEQLAFQKEQQRKLDRQKAVYRNMEFENPYANVENPYAGLQTSFENVFEDLTVNQQQAQFEAQQGQQQRANIMQGLRGAAGASGIAGLAQTMAREGQLQTQRASASIGMQEASNQRAAAQGAAAVQTMEASREQLMAQGEATAEMTRLGGEAALQEMEMSRQATLLGMQMGETAGANQALQQAYANQMSAGAQQTNLLGQQAAGMYGMAGQTMAATGQIVGGAAAGYGAANAPVPV
tara:strand:- start:327 stop:1178 length:852 start_codon:yes stop_codon:yes gene_type:complete